MKSLFSKSPQIAITEDDENIDNLDQQTLSGPSVNSSNVKTESEEEQQQGFSLFQTKKTKKPIIDPPMPFMGKPLSYNAVLERTKNAKLTSQRILSSAETMAIDSIVEVKSIPVPDEPERVKVSSLVTDRMMQKPSKKSIKMSKENNLEQILRVVNWKRYIVELMNFNFDRAFVRDAGVVDLDRARTKTTTRDDKKIDSDIF